jgi:hypothetical protein
VQSGAGKIFIESELRFAETIGDTVISRGFIERRRTRRWPVGHIRMVRVEAGAVPRYCLVIDESDGGVRIRTPPDFEVPSELILRRGDTQTTCKTVWRRGPLVGAEVVSRPTERPTVQ